MLGSPSSIPLPSTVGDVGPSAGDEDEDGLSSDEPELPLLSPARPNTSPDRHVKAQARGEIHE